MSKIEEQVRIGLTGNIGSGKTFVSAIFTKLGIPVFNSDNKAKECMANDLDLIKDIKDLFGDNIYKNGILQKEILAEIVFSDEKSLMLLNKLVHPAVNKIFETWCKNITSKVVIKEAAILFESNSDVGLQNIICVLADRKTRINRVIKRDKTLRELVIRRIERQMPQDEKEILSDFVIRNNGSELLIPQVIKIITQIS